MCIVYCHSVNETYTVYWHQLKSTEVGFLLILPSPKMEGLNILDNSTRIHKGVCVIHPVDTEIGRCK